MKFCLEIDVDYAWYRDRDGGSVDAGRVAGTLRGVAGMLDGCSVEDGGWGCFVRDGNGNKVGSWKFEEEGRLK